MTEVPHDKQMNSVIENSELFSRLEPDAIENIGKKCDLVRFDKGEEVFHEGDLADYMYIIGEGDVGVFKLMGQGEHELMRLGVGAHFGEMAMISSARRNATLRAKSDLLCARMDETSFNALMEADARFAQRMLKALAERLRDTDEAAMQDMVLAHQALSFSLAKLADSRDPETGAHLYRVREYCILLSELLREHPKYSETITDSFIENIYLVAPLHDIGKVAIPDGILLKNGKLTDAEFEIMSTHTLLGAEAVDTVLEFCDFELFRMAKRVILGHHERYDGLGYPRGVMGEAIPLEARIMSLADVYDALLSERVYKRAFEYHEARAEIEQYAGSRFDPSMVEIMLEHIDEFEEVHRRFSEGTTDYSTVA